MKMLNFQMEKPKMQTIKHLAFQMDLQLMEQQER